MSKPWIIFVLLFMIGASALAADRASAEALLAQAETQAKAEQKSVFVIFGASWCPDCDVLDAFLDGPAAKAILDRHFVIVHLNVFEESGDYGPARNTPGSDSLIRKFAQLAAGETMSLPYTVIVDEHGDLLADSRRPASSNGKARNVGFPQQADDIAWYVQMLRRGTISLTQDEAAQLATSLSRPQN